MKGMVSVPRAGVPYIGTRARRTSPKIAHRLVAAPGADVVRGQSEANGGAHLHDPCTRVTPSPSTTALRILHAASSDRVSGSSRYICDLGQRQRDAGHTVGVALPRRGPGGSIYETLPPGLEVLPLLGSPGWLGLARAIGRFRPDIIHFHDGRGPRAIRWIPGHPPSVITLHLGYKRAMKPADGLIRIARWQDVAPYRGPVVDVANWRPAAPQAARADAAHALRAGLGVGPQQVLIGCVGRLHPQKGAAVLVEGMRGLTATDVVVAFVGDGPERASLAALAQDDPRVRFLGHRTDVDAWYGAFDAFVTPSYSEHSPLVVLEAMAAGLPIAAAANPGSAEMLEGQPASLFPPGDAAALAAILQGWTAGRPARRAYDMRRFDPDRAAAAIEAFYREVIAIRR